MLNITSRARASGSGWAAAFGRLGAFVAPFIVLVVYRSYGTERDILMYLLC